MARAACQLPTRKSDIVARYGGEEFVLVLPETTLDGAITKAERMRAAIASYSFEHGSDQPGGRVSVSIGVACFPNHGQEKAELIAVADQMLYKAKHAGRNAVRSPQA